MHLFREFFGPILRVVVAIVVLCGIAIGCGGEDAEVEEDVDSTCESLRMGTVELESELATEANISHVDYAISTGEDEISFVPKDLDDNRMGEVRFRGQEPEGGEPMSMSLVYEPDEGSGIAVDVELGVVPAHPNITPEGPPLLYLNGAVQSDGQTVGFMMTGRLNDGALADIDAENPILDTQDAVFFVDDGSQHTSLDVVVDGEPQVSEEDLETWIDEEVGRDWFDKEAAAVMVGAVFDDNVVNQFQMIEEVCRAMNRSGVVDQSHLALSACEVARSYEDAADMAEAAGEFLVGTILIPIGGAELAISAAQRDVEAGDIIGTFVGIYLGVAIASVSYATGLAIAPVVLALGGGLLLGSTILRGGAAIAASTCGNPLVSALNGVAFPFRQRGEFVWYTGSTATSWQVQVRLVPHLGSDCRDGIGVEAVAVSTGEQRATVYFDHDHRLLIDGQVQKLDQSYWQLDDGTEIKRRTVTEGANEIYIVTSPSGERFRVDVFDDRLDIELSVPDELRAEARGLIGGSTDTGLELRDGTVLEEPVAKRDLYGRFGTSWQVSPEESLFDYEAGKGWEDYRTTGEVPAPRRLDDLDEEQLAYAEYVCKQAGQVTDPTLLHHCMLDVGCTGDASYMTTYRRISPPKRNLELVDEAGNPVVGMVDERNFSPIGRFGFGSPGSPGGDFSGSDVDILDQASCPADIEKGAESVGGKRIRTIDGLTYDFQAAGEFVLVESKTDDPLMVQVRQQPRGDDRCPNARRNTAVAAQMGEHRVAFHHFGAPRLQVDGEEVHVVGGFLALGDGHTITREDDDEYLLQWPDGSWLFVEFKSKQLNIKFNSHYTRLGQLQGVFGQFSGYPTRDIALRNGTVLEDWSADEIHSVFADSWRISQEESLFDYEDGVTTESFTDPSVPSEMMTVDDIPTDDEADARARCEEEEITHPATLATCIVDVYCADDDEDEIDEITEDLAQVEDPVEDIDHDGMPSGHGDPGEPGEPVDPPDFAHEFPSLEGGAFGLMCMLEDVGELGCWNVGFDGEIEPIDYDFSEVEYDDEIYPLELVTVAASDDVCGLDTGGVVHCWSMGFGGEIDEHSNPMGSSSYILLEKGMDDYGCVLNEDGEVSCWFGPQYHQYYPLWEDDPPEDVTFVDLALALRHMCGLTDEGAVECWGEDEDGKLDPPDGEVFESIVAGFSHTCGLKADGSVSCWGDVESSGSLDLSLDDTDSVGPFVKIDASISSVCGLKEDGTIECWSRIDADPEFPTGTFVDLGMGAGDYCAVDDQGSVECW